MNYNSCSPVWAFRPRDNYPVFSSRKILISELLVMFIIFFIVDLYLDWKNKKLEGNLALNPRLHCWRETFYRCFGDHIVGLGFAMTFSPYVFEMILAIFHLILFILLVVSELKNKNWSGRLTLYMRLIGVALFLCGMIGIGRCRVSKEGGCSDYLYNKPS